MPKLLKSLIGVCLTVLLSCSDDEPTTPTKPPTPSPYDISYTFYFLTPSVIPDTYSGNVLLEVHYASGTNPVLQTSWGQAIPMKDEGKNGDRIAHDKIFSCLVASGKILPLNNAASVFRPYVGQINLAPGLNLNVFAQVSTNAIPLLTPEKINADIQYTPHIVNIVTNYISPNAVSNHTRKFYKHFGDDYDFLAVIYEGFQTNAHHIQAKQPVKGIGGPLFDQTAFYGSAGKLSGLNIFPLPLFFDGASHVYLHELGHQWINYLTLPAFQNSTPHWPVSDFASGMMGFSIGTAKAGGLFPFNPVQQDADTWKLIPVNGTPVFNDLELYLMGLLPAEEVADHFIFENQNQPLQTNAIWKGPVSDLTIEDIIQQYGAREPGVNNSPKEFRQGTIIVTAAPLTAIEMSFYDFFSARAELEQEVNVSSAFSKYIGKPFYLSTGQRAKLKTALIR